MKAQKYWILDFVTLIAIAASAMQADEAPPADWLKERKKECRSGEPVTIL